MRRKKPASSVALSEKGAKTKEVRCMEEDRAFPLVKFRYIKALKREGDRFMKEEGASLKSCPVTERS